ncbi:MAG: DedA family protein [Bacteroidota bacterium]|nr:DedA family protein [Bacteroidota bacterium]
MFKKILFAFLLLFSITALKANPVDVPVKPATESLSFIQHIEAWYKDNTNYFSITALMACESSILPVPSEIVIPPAVYVALEPDSQLNIFLIILFGTIGALVGASFNYLMSMWLGRFVVYKFADSKAGKLFLLSSEKIQKAEVFFNSHGKTSTFVGRFIPVIRHLISIPAGLAKMNYLNFILFTALGAGLWNCCLAALGYLAHGQQEMINKYSHQISFIFLGIGIIILAVFIYKSVQKKRAKA